MGMAGRVRLGGGTIRALPAAADVEIDLDAQGLPVAVAFEQADDRGGADRCFALYQDLADAMALDGALDELD
jgi:hypothetical protein